MKLGEEFLYLREFHEPLEEILADNNFTLEVGMPNIIAQLFTDIHHGKYDAEKILQYLKVIAPHILEDELVPAYVDKGTEFPETNSLKPEEILKCFEREGVNDSFYNLSHQGNKGHAADKFFASLVQHAIERVLEGPSSEVN